MFFKSALISTLWLASTVFAAHGHQHRRSLNRLEHLTNVASRSTKTETKPGEAGLIFDKTPKSASVTFKAPTLNDKVAGDAAVVLMFGYSSCSNILGAYLQFGVDGDKPYYTASAMVDSSTGSSSGASYSFGAVNAGDEMTFTIETSGTVKFATGGHSKSHKFTSQLCPKNVGFAVLALEDNMPEFGEVSFGNVRFSGSSNSPEADTILNMELNGKIVATTSYENGKGVIKQQK